MCRLYAEFSVAVFAVVAIAVIFLLQPKKYKHAKLQECKNVIIQNYKV